MSNLRAGEFDPFVPLLAGPRPSSACAREEGGAGYSFTPSDKGWPPELRGGTKAEKSDSARLRGLAAAAEKRVRERIHEMLREMDASAFEHLVRALLDAMGYTETEVTTKGRDGGVDVKARIQLGITEIVEVVQAKKHQKTIGRPVLDGLRGPLHRFGAVRGTIITTSSFSRGAVAAAFEHGAAPITLIDGEQFVDL